MHKGSIKIFQGNFENILIKILKDPSMLFQGSFSGFSKIFGGNLILSLYQTL